MLLILEKIGNTMDLFDDLPPDPDAATTAIAPGAALLRGLALGDATALLQAVEVVLQQAPGAKLSLHQDRDEQDVSAPIVSLSLGLPAVFLFGTSSRKDPRNGIGWCMVMWWSGAGRRGWLIMAWPRWRMVRMHCWGADAST